MEKIEVERQRRWRDEIEINSGGLVCPIPLYVSGTIELRGKRSRRRSVCIMHAGHHARRVSLVRASHNSAGRKARRNFWKETSHPLAHVKEKAERGYPKCAEWRILIGHLGGFYSVGETEGRY